VVLDDQIVGQSWSRVVLNHDPTTHAEMSAIRDAARRLKGRDLSGAILYSSSRPCAMCEAAAAWAGIAGMIHGKAATRAGRPQLCR
jgi:tRNA(Arg) A34 adenosine deaminase TadA